MNRNSNKELTFHSRGLRKNMTKEERHLWYDFLKSCSVTIYRQKVIGSYILDFYCPAAKLAIEIDGSQHFMDDGMVTDKIRDEYLKSKGIRVLRYSNYDINTNFTGVCEDILMNLKVST